MVSVHSVARVGANVLAGAVAWTATEYVMHRWVLHGSLRLGGMHRAHHRAPLATSLPARTAGHLAIAGVAALGSTASALISPPAAAAWAAGYSTYEISHWNAHHRPARTAWGERLRERHMAHHYGAPRSNMGVTMNWWDRLLRTEA